MAAQGARSKFNRCAHTTLGALAATIFRRILLGWLPVFFFFEFLFFSQEHTKNFAETIGAVDEMILE